MATIGPIYFVWLGIFNVMVIAQFWSFANDIYNPEEGKRLFPMIMAGQNIGAAFGFSINFFFVQKLGVYPMMLLAGGVLSISIVLTNIVHRRELKRFEEKKKSEQDKKDDDKAEAEKPLGKEGGFQLVFKSRYLLYIAFLILTLNLVNTTGEYIRDTVFKQKAEETIQVDTANYEEAKAEYLSKLESGFQAISGYLAIAIQLLLVSRLFSWIGIRGTLFILPLISLGGNIFIASLGASFMVVQWAKIFENSTDYSLMNALRAALYLITSREEKYKAKAVIDTFFVRAGDFLTGLFVFLGTTYLAFNPERFAKFNIFIILIWLVLCYLIVKQHKKISAQKEQEKYFVAR
jgi:AAA family ATP:ADP antiporter